MAELPWSKFFWDDWESDQGLRLCSLAAQGIWMRMLCVCARHEPRGYLAINGQPLEVKDVAQLAGVDATEAATLMDELDRRGVFSRNRKGCIYSRRMIRDDKRSKEGRKNKKRGLLQSVEKPKEKPPPSRVATRGPSPQKPEARSQKKKDIPDGISKKTPRKALEDVLRSEVADAVINHRQRLRKPLTDVAASRLAANFQKCPDPNEAALMMIERGWAGCSPEWVANAMRAQPPSGTVYRPDFRKKSNAETAVEILAEIASEPD